MKHIPIAHSFSGELMLLTSSDKEAEDLWMRKCVIFLKKAFPIWQSTTSNSWEHSDLKRGWIARIVLFNPWNNVLAKSHFLHFRRHLFVFSAETFFAETSHNMPILCRHEEPLNLTPFSLFFSLYSLWEESLYKVFQVCFCCSILHFSNRTTEMEIALICTPLMWKA